MRRITLVLGLLALLAVSACGSSGDGGSESGSAIDPRVVAAVQASLARGMEARLRQQIRDPAFRIVGFRCRGANAETVQCVIRGTDSTGASGNIGLAAVIDPARGTAIAQFTGTSRGRWASAFNRAAARERAQGGQQR